VESHRELVGLYTSLAAGEDGGENDGNGDDALLLAAPGVSCLGKNGDDALLLVPGVLGLGKNGDDVLALLADSMSFRAVVKEPRFLETRRAKIRICMMQ